MVRFLTKHCCHLLPIGETKLRHGGFLVLELLVVVHQARKSCGVFESSRDLVAQRSKILQWVHLDSKEVALSNLVTKDR